MTIPELSIRRPVMAWMLMFGVIVFGAIGLSRLGVSYLPDYDFPTLSVNVYRAGAAPELMETEIVDRLERELISVERLKTMTSTMKQGSANISLEFEMDRNVDEALQEVQSKVSAVRMPLNVDPPTISKSNSDDQPILWIGLESTRPTVELVRYVETSLRDIFQLVPGVGDIQLSAPGGRMYRVWLDPEKLKSFELTALDVRNSLAQDHYEVAAGYLENELKEMNVRVMGEGFSEKEIGEIRILKRGGKSIYDSNIRIQDVARVEDGLSDGRRVTRVNGSYGVGLGIKKQRGTNAVEVAHRVKAKMEELKKRLPPDMKMGINFDSTTFIEDSISETKFTLILSAIVTAVVCYLFLGTWSSTMNILLSIPFSIVGSFLVFYGMGFTLNLFTLLGLSLAIGIVVDDAIMVLENIVRHAEMGKNRVDAARDGAKEITFAAVAASVSVMAIFIPILFVQGIIGKFLFQFGIAITASVALSLVEALTITPMRCSQFLKTGARKSRFEAKLDHLFEWVTAVYGKGLSWSLDHRIKVVCGSLFLFFLSLLVVRSMRGEIIPPQDQGTILLKFQSSIGSSMKATEVILLEVEKEVQSWPEVQRVFGSVGGMGGGEINTGTLFLSLKPMGERKKSQMDLMKEARAKLSKIPHLKKLVVTDLSLRGFSAKRELPVEFSIQGGNWAKLDELSQQMLKELNESGLVTDMDTDYRKGQPEIRILPDREKAAASGVSVQTVADTIETAIAGYRVGRVTADGRRYDMNIRFEVQNRLIEEDLNRIWIRTDYGEMIPLSRVVTMDHSTTTQTLSRRNRERAIAVSGNIAPGMSQAAALAKVEEIGKRIIPEGYHLQLSGVSQTFRESFQQAIFILLLGILVAYMVLASQFNSFLHPITVLLALPFSISGALLGLWATNQSLNLYSMIGMILLMGIVKKNSIMLVEFTNHLRREGRSVRDAIMEGCQIRLRPILMTSFATIAAAIPPALALGPGAESRIPMSVTILGGVSLSTFLTLLVVPAFYSWVAKWDGETKAAEISKK
jgi:HAE1 family hydrophobic/amphiphilic exporter-1